jgi:hypothetical protein
VVGTYVTLPADDLAREQAATARLQTLGLGDRFATLFGRATAAAYADMAQTLISPKFDLSYILNFAVIATLEGVETLDKTNTDAALAPYNDDKLGEGLFRLETAQSGALRQPTAFLDAIGKSGQALTLDRIGAKLPDDQLAAYAGTLVGDVTASPQQIATDIQAKAQELGV